MTGANSVTSTGRARRRWIIAIGVLVFIVSIVMPIFYLTSIIYVLLPIKFNRHPWGMTTVFKWVNQMRPWALGRRNWLFAGSLRSGQRAANIMTLIQSAKLNGLDPYAYLSDVLKRLPTHKVTQIEELLPHCWKPKGSVQK